MGVCGKELRYRSLYSHEYRNKQGPGEVDESLYTVKESFLDKESAAG
jgi:hypothetical protein